MMSNRTYLPLRLVFGVLTFISMTAAEETGNVRKPLPSAEVIAALPKDGGEEFNRLIFTQSPYLLQHARNPVDWWPWGPEAFARAKKENKPVFLSIGYTTCHWCHVMEHESFEDAEVARMVNEHFIPVKVDREERPDIDEVYMTVTQALNGSGGWPMTVFMTPDKDPFFAGTYFPKESSAGRPGVKFILKQIKAAWEKDRENVVETATQLTERLGEVMINQSGGKIQPDIFDRAFQEFSDQYDSEFGGFSRAPKFPVPPNLMFLLRYHKRTGNDQALAMVEKTLRAMRNGGVYDQIGFGIHRYSTDRVWLLPHFEKMLYDQALAVMAYIEAYQVTGDEFYSRTAEEILSYVQRDMTHSEGGFFSAEDADSLGVEGKFYVWSVAEIQSILGKNDAGFFIDLFNLTDEGNFVEEATSVRTGENIPHLIDELTTEQRERFEPLRKKLFEHRAKRTHPQKDDKILTDWNGLMMAAFARAGQALGNNEYIEAAKASADFVLDKLITDEHRLLKRYRNGNAGLTAHLEDYTFVIWGLLDVYEATFDTRYFEKAIELQAVIDEWFWDDEGLGYFMTADDAEKLIVRVKRLYGGAIPSGNSTAILNLARLYHMTGKPEYAKRLDQLVSAFAADISRSPMSFSHTLCGLDFQFGPCQQIVVCGTAKAEDVEIMIKKIREPYFPNKVILFRDDQSPEDLAALAGYTRDLYSIDGKATAFVCQDFTCQLPNTEVDKVVLSLDPAKKKNQ